MTDQQPESPRSNNRPLVLGSILVIVALIALVLWQSGGRDTRTSSADPSAISAEEASADVSTGEEANDSAGQEAAELPTEEPTVVPEDTPTTEPTETAEPPDPTETPTPEAAQQVSDLPPIAYVDLPPEAHDTIELIDEGGPFPYDKDGTTFQNREGILPDRQMGYYAEYTVITPGSPDRGARRIVAGADGEMYYTDDHYASFQEVIR
jgi:ribonuclease T1